MDLAPSYRIRRLVAKGISILDANCKSACTGIKMYSCCENGYKRITAK